ncbi:MAG: pilus assembly protein [Chthoniobacterales bacterium]|nr:pilus assembly protein [Chthoniobacterales bacterium]
MLDRRDTHHEWAKQQVAHLRHPLVTCEAVVSEAFFLLAPVRAGTGTFAGLLRDQLVRVDPDFLFCDNLPEILDQMEQYKNVPMSFADACLVRMTEIERDSSVFTTDRDFLTYRRNRRERIPLISPF